MRKQKAGRDKISKIEKSIEKDKIDQIEDEERELNKNEKENFSNLFFDNNSDTLLIIFSAFTHIIKHFYSLIIFTI